MPRFYLETEQPHSLLTPARMDVFGTRVIPAGRPKGKRPYTPIRFAACGWQGWNSDPIMEDRMARLPGAGSFYWPNALRAYLAAKQVMASDPRVVQIKLETISGREIGRLYR